MAVILLSTTWGPVTVETCNGRAVRCSLPALPQQPAISFGIRSSADDAISRYLAAVLTGRNAPRPPMAAPAGTQFQQDVWKAIARIPKGTTLTYAALARAVGRPSACRAAANACGRNPLPLFIPCHRITGSNGRLGGFSAGIAWKKLLLAVELKTPTAELK
jgi:methylated-DNA-[protein]-cysteine S-methyltransferase